MFEIIVSLSSNSVEREIDEYHDSGSSGSSSSRDSNSKSSSSGVGNTTNEQYLSGVLGVPLEILQEDMRIRMAFGSLVGTSTNAPSFILLRCRYPF